MVRGGEGSRGGGEKPRGSSGSSNAGERSFDNRVELVSATGVLVVEPVGDSGGVGFVDDTEDCQTGEGTGVLGGRP